MGAKLAAIGGHNSRSGSGLYCSMRASCLVYAAVEGLLIQKALYTITVL